MTRPVTEPPASGAAATARIETDIVRATRQYLALHLTPLRAAGGRGEAGISHAKRLSTVYDGLLASFFMAAVAEQSRAGGAPLGPLALLAVGGYGRGMLGIGSDLDLVLLAPSVDDPRLRAIADRILYPLWDGGVAVGHAVRTPDEFVSLAREDLRTATTIFDARIIAGDRALAEETIARGWRALFDDDVNDFVGALSDEMLTRHGRYGASVYLLEPDVKYGRGALRDLDIARWALRARFRANDIADALKLGAVSPHDAEALVAAREFFWRVRGVLHAPTGKRRDRLTFDEQETCARALGMVPASADAGDESDESLRLLGLAAERFMQDYYRHARTVATTVDRLLESCRTARSSLDRIPRSERVAEGLDRFEDALFFADSEAPRRDPALALRIVETALARGVHLAGRARDRIAALAREPEWSAQLRNSPTASAVFRRLLVHGAPANLRARGTPVSAAEQGRASVLAELHDLGLLLAMVPEFEPVTGRVHHDVYHVYTVDVHSVAAVDRLHQIARGETGETYAQARRLLADVERFDLLCLATLLHDVGKGRNRDHSTVGAELAVEIVGRLGLPTEDAETVAWLVREHLALYHAATRRDLADPAAIAHVVDLVRDRWRLRLLYLLTVADLSTTSPTAMTSWKARMLDELLATTESALARTASPTDRRTEILRARAVAVAPADEAVRIDSFLTTMPPRYLLATAATSVARHARLLDRVPATRTLVQLAPLEGAARVDLAEVVFVAPDRVGLLARLASVLHANRLDVQSAELYSRATPSGNEAFDVFVVRRRDDDPGALVRLAARLPSDLARVLAAPLLEPPASIEAPAVARRAEPAVATKVEIDNFASERETVIELFTRDRPGLLLAIAFALYELGLTISLAKVNTEGRRVADVFYVTGTDGAKVAPERFDAIRAHLLAAAEAGPRS